MSIKYLKSKTKHHKIPTTLKFIEFIWKSNQFHGGSHTKKNHSQSDSLNLPHQNHESEREINKAATFMSLYQATLFSRLWRFFSFKSGFEHKYSFFEYDFPSCRQFSYACSWVQAGVFVCTKYLWKEIAQLNLNITLKNLDSITCTKVLGSKKIQI